MEAETKKYIDNAFELLDRIGAVVDEFDLELAGKPSLDTDELHITIRIPMQKSN